MKYIQRQDNEEIELKPKEIFRSACCDCGLVHDMAVAAEDNGNIGLAFRRDNRATAQLRRHRFGNLQKKDALKYKMVVTMPLMEE